MAFIERVRDDGAPKPCKDCKGKGHIIVKETYGDGDECLVPYECTTCHGTGLKPDTDGSGDFDIDGAMGGDDDD